MKKRRRPTQIINTKSKGGNLSDVPRSSLAIVGIVASWIKTIPTQPESAPNFLIIKTPQEEPTTDYYLYEESTQ